jgi:uncharacterized protein
MQAVRNKDKPEIERLSKTRRVLNAQVGNSTALLVAAGMGDTDIVRMLLEAGANPNFTANDGFTPLMMAVRDAHVDTVQLLVNAGANSGGTNLFGLSPMTMAQMMASGSSARVLVHEGQTPQQARAATLAKGKAIVEILQRGAN